MLDRLLQDDLAGAEITAFFTTDRFFANIGIAIVVHPGGALWTCAKTFLAGEINWLTAFIAGLVLTKIKFRQFVGIEFDGGGKTAAHLVTETREWSNLALAQQRFDFYRLILTARDNLPQRIIATAALELLVGFANLPAALRTRLGQYAKITGNGVVVVAFGAFNHVPRHLGDLAHEFVAREFALLDTTELPFPVAGQFRLGQFLDAEAVQQRHQVEGLGRRDQFTAFAQHVLLADQVFDDLGARCRGAEAAAGHRRLQFLVVDHLAGAFHGRQQGGFRIARRRFGGAGLDRDFLGLDLFVLVDRDQVAFVAALAFLAMHGKPARIDQDLAFGLERMAFDAGDTGGHQVFGGREEHRQEAADDEVVQFLLGFVEVLRRLRRGDDGEVIAHLRVIEDALVRQHPVARQDLVRKRRVASEQDFVVTLAGTFAGEHAHRFLDRGEVVLGQTARIGPRVSQHLVLFVERLGQAERRFGREPETGVGLALQAGQVKQQRRQAGFRFGFLADDAGLARSRRLDRLGTGDFPQTVGAGMLVLLLALEAFVEPFASVIAGLGGKFSFDFPVIARLEVTNLALALDDDGQRRRLYATDRGQVEAASLRIEGGHRPGAVDADKPVGFGTADGGVGQPLHFATWAQPRETVANRLRRHRLQPQPLHRFANLGMLDNVIEDQLTLASRVTRVDQAINVLALDQFVDHTQTGCAFFNGVECKMGRNDRQMGKRPFAAFDFEFFRAGQFEQMTDGRRQHIVFGFEIVVVFGKPAQCLGDVAGNRGFFGNDQFFAHGVAL